MVFLDEGSSNNQIVDKKYNWLPIRDHPNLESLLKRGEKYSILLVYKVDGYMAWMVQLGSIKATDFNAFAKSSKLPLINPFPMERSGQ